MPSEDFVTKTRDQIAAYQKREDSQRDEKLHDSGVLKTAGQGTWGSSRTECKSCVEKIGTITYAAEGDDEFVLRYGGEDLTVTFYPLSAVIHYKGMRGRGDTFAPKVKGEGLIYADGMNTEIAVEKMAERMVSALVER